MTLGWKRRVLAKLDENKRDGKKPGNLTELARMLRNSEGKPADKAGITRTFKTEQMSSSYVDAISELLDVGPPLVEAGDDPDLENDVDYVRSLPAEKRREVIEFFRRNLK